MTYKTSLLITLAACALVSVWALTIFLSGSATANDEPVVVLDNAAIIAGAPTPVWCDN